MYTIVWWDLQIHVLTRKISELDILLTETSTNARGIFYRGIYSWYTTDM